MDTRTNSVSPAAFGRSEREFGAEKRNLNGHVVFSRGNVEFIGEAGKEGDPQQYALKFWPANEDDAPLRIIVRGHYAYFQVGPSQKNGHPGITRTSTNRIIGNDVVETHIVAEDSDGKVNMDLTIRSSRRQ